MSKHRTIWKQHYLNIPDGYQIHHINGKHSDNNILNLACLTPKRHAAKHKGKIISKVYGVDEEDYIDGMLNRNLAIAIPGE